MLGPWPRRRGYNVHLSAPHHQPPGRIRHHINTLAAAAGCWQLTHTLKHRPFRALGRPFLSHRITPNAHLPVHRPLPRTAPGRTSPVVQDAYLCVCLSSVCRPPDLEPSLPQHRPNPTLHPPKPLCCLTGNPLYSRLAKVASRAEPLLLPPHTPPPSITGTPKRRSQPRRAP